MAKPERQAVKIKTVIKILLDAAFSVPFTGIYLEQAELTLRDPS